MHSKLTLLVGVVNLTVGVANLTSLTFLSSLKMGNINTFLTEEDYHQIHEETGCKWQTAAAGKLLLSYPPCSHGVPDSAALLEIRPLGQEKQRIPHVSRGLIHGPSYLCNWLLVLHES